MLDDLQPGSSGGGGYSSHHLPGAGAFLAETAQIVYRSLACASTRNAIVLPCLSVCLSVCPSRCGIVSKRLHISSNFLHILVGPSVVVLVFWGPPRCYKSPREHRQRRRKIWGVWKICDFRPKSPFISETERYWLWVTNRKSHVPDLSLSFRWLRVTLKGGTR